MKKASTQLATEVYDYFKVTFLDKQPIRFLIVGGTAFVVNGGLLFVLHGLLKINLLASQIFASEVAIIVSFSLHHHWTYKGYQNKPLYQRFLRFNATALGGTAISTLTLLFFVHVLKIYYLVSFSFGAIFALSWNYFANKYLIWAQVTHEDE